MRLEVVVTDTSEAVVAEKAGASRVELVREFTRGGLTPDDRTIESVITAVSIPVHVMIRPHDNGFVYDAEQKKEILNAAARMRGLGVSAVVFGALDERGHVASALVKDVASAAALPLTFHRAFDQIVMFSAAYALLSGLAGVERVLTSGGGTNAWDGRERLRELCYGNTAPTVIAAGKIEATYVSDLMEYTSAKEVHVGTGVRTDGKLDGRKVEQIAELVLKGTVP